MLLFVQSQIASKCFSSPMAAAMSMPYACPSPTVSPPWSMRDTRPSGCT
jgi:hypothetical protein